MFTIVLSIVAYSMAQKGKRSVAIMATYTTLLTIFYLFLLVGIINRQDNDRFVYFAVEFTLQFLLCIVTIYDTKRGVEKAEKTRIMLPMVANFKLQEIRINNMLSPEQIANIIGISIKQYTKYELGQEDIPASVIIQLAKLYKVSTDYLLGMELQEVQKTAPGSEQQK